MKFRSSLSRLLTTLSCTTALSCLPLLALADQSAAVETSGEGSETELAKASQNPLGSLISVPFESNFYFGIGPSDATAYILSLKPVYPMNFGELNLINRFIIPVMYGEGQAEADLAALVSENSIQTGFSSGLSVATGSEFGLGDITWQGFVTPASPGDWILGLGPAMTFPTHTAARFGTDKWSAGPAFVALTMPGPWVIGGLVQQSWSYAGPDDASTVNKATFQYFLNYNFGDGWYLSSSPVMTANWGADSGERWTIPLGGGIGKMHNFGNLPVDFKLAGYYNVEKPEFSPDWQLQFTVKFLFPK
jgi:hypothetical protein